MCKMPRSRASATKRIDAVYDVVAATRFAMLARRYQWSSFTPFVICTPVPGGRKQRCVETYVHVVVLFNGNVSMCVLALNASKRFQVKMRSQQWTKILRNLSRMLSACCQRSIMTYFDGSQYIALRQEFLNNKQNVRLTDRPTDYADDDQCTMQRVNRNLAASTAATTTVRAAAAAAAVGQRHIKATNQSAIPAVSRVFARFVSHCHRWLTILRTHTFTHKHIRCRLDAAIAYTIALIVCGHQPKIFTWQCSYTKEHIHILNSKKQI